MKCWDHLGTLPCMCVLSMGRMNCLNTFWESRMPKLIAKIMSMRPHFTWLREKGSLICCLCWFHSSKLTWSKILLMGGQQSPMQPSMVFNSAWNYCTRVERSWTTRTDCRGRRCTGQRGATSVTWRSTWWSWVSSSTCRTSRVRGRSRSPPIMDTLIWLPLLPSIISSLRRGKNSWSCNLE